VVGSVIPGFRNLKQVISNLYGADKSLSNDEFDFVRSIFNE
jgi:aryl-alcohol dehydrogenase-like predicted oxidoreductase